MIDIGLLWGSIGLGIREDGAAVHINRFVLKQSIGACPVLHSKGHMSLQGLNQVRNIALTGIPQVRSEHGNEVATPPPRNWRRLTQ